MWDAGWCRSTGKEIIRDRGQNRKMQTEAQTQPDRSIESLQEWRYEFRQQTKCRTVESHRYSKWTIKTRSRLDRSWRQPAKEQSLWYNWPSLEIFTSRDETASGNIGELRQKNMLFENSWKCDATIANDGIDHYDSNSGCIRRVDQADGFVIISKECAWSWPIMRLFSVHGEQGACLHNHDVTKSSITETTGRNAMDAWGTTTWREINLIETHELTRSVKCPVVCVGQTEKSHPTVLICLFPALRFSGGVDWNAWSLAIPDFVKLRRSRPKGLTSPWAVLRPTACCASAVLDSSALGVPIG